MRSPSHVPLAEVIDSNVGFPVAIAIPVLITDARELTSNGTPLLGPLAVLRSTFVRMCWLGLR